MIKYKEVGSAALWNNFSFLNFPRATSLKVLQPK